MITHAGVRIAVTVAALLVPPTAVVATTVPVGEPPAGVAIGLEFPRHLQLSRTPEVGEVEVTVDNQSAQPFRIGALAVDSPLFERGEPRIDEMLVPAGWRFDYPVGIGAAVCGNDTSGTTWVHATVVDDDAATTERYAVDDTPLRRLNDRECGARAIAAAVGITLGAPFAVDDAGVVTATLTLERRAGDPTIEVVAVRGSVLLVLTPTTATEPLLQLAPGTTSASTTVAIEVGRCDPHALIESRRTFRFSIWVALGGAEEEYLEFLPAADVQQAVTEQIDACVAAQS